MSGSRRVTATFGPAAGRGPVYAAWGGGLTRFVSPPPPGSPFFGTAWSGAKLLWIASPSYEGPVLVRGRQLDGLHGLGFTGDGTTVWNELQLSPRAARGRAGWRSWPSSARLQAPGCYGIQVDGTDFSEVIVFKAILASS